MSRYLSENCVEARAALLVSVCRVQVQWHDGCRFGDEGDLCRIYLVTPARLSSCEANLRDLGVKKVY